LYQLVGAQRKQQNTYCPRNHQEQKSGIPFPESFSVHLAPQNSQGENNAARDKKNQHSAVGENAKKRVLVGQVRVVIEDHDRYYQHKYNAGSSCQPVIKDTSEQLQIINASLS